MPRMTDQGHILKYGYTFTVLFILVALAIVAQLFMIQFGEGPQLRKQSEREVIREIPIEAERGNIYSSDGQLLATTMPVYDVHFDPVTVPFETFANELPALARGLAQELGLYRAARWEKKLQEARNQGQRYYPIAEQVSYQKLQRLRHLPIFENGQFKGGFIVEQKHYRKMPLGKIAERTIGRDRPHLSTGLEGAFERILEGRNGLRLKQKVKGGHWKPITDHYEVEPRNGLDLVSTLDTRMQDVAHHELLRALERYEADHGTAVVMDVQTGAIKALANLGRTEEGTYYEKRNYAIWESTEPGSTFKLASVLALLEDGFADTSTRVNTGNGHLRIYNANIYDSRPGGYGEISLADAFAYSSNVGIVKLINQHYGDQPRKFVDRLYNLGLHHKLGLPIRGEGQPFIPTPGQGKWSGLSLPWMAFGYQVSFTPLQILSLYNAVANDGQMVKPRLLEATRRHGRTLEEKNTQVLQASICSRRTCEALQALLRRVVTHGTAQNINSPQLPLAGKTGTCELNYWKGAEHQYQASFVGYFPADKPRYSCIVVINSPNYHRGYYGSAVAAPVFRNIAENIFAAAPKPLLTEKPLARKDTFGRQADIKATLRALRPGKPLPSLKGLPGAALLSRLENLGFQVKINGNGRVNWHYPPAGTVLTTKQLIELKLG
jgi:cell division protein FtsI (penicillin-binding protein 3)